MLVKLLKKTKRNSSAILKYQNHPSITTIKKMHLLNKFSFKNASISNIKKELQKLGTSKATQKSDLPTKIIKENFDTLAPFLFGSVNSFIDLSNFPKNLKFEDITPAYKKSSRNKCQNFLTNSSRNIKQIFEKDLTYKLG